MKNKIEQLLIECFYLSNDSIDFDIDEAVDTMYKLVTDEIIKSYNKGLEFKNTNELWKN